MFADFDRRTAGSVYASSEGRAMNDPMTQRPPRPRRLPSAAGLTAGLTGVLAGTALLLGPAQAAEPSVGYAVPPEIFVLDAQSLTQERARNKVVSETREALVKSGQTPLYAPTEATELSLRDAASQALHRNLDIKRSGLSKAIAERALIEAQAVFDPVFVATGGASVTSQFRRTEFPTKYKVSTEFVPVGALDNKGVFRCTPAAATLTQSPSLPGCYVITFPTRSTVLATQYNHNRPAGYYQLSGSEGIQANNPSTSQAHTQETYTGTVEILQQLPWGPSLNLTASTRHQQTYYGLNQNNGLTPTFGRYNRPYFTTLSVGASLPLPYTMNFGPTAAADVQADIARHSIDVAELEVRSVINGTLLQVDTLYWQLVGAIGSIEVANQSLVQAQKQSASIQRLLAQGFVTESDRGQAEAQISGIRTTQQQLFANYVTASLAMRRLLDSTDNGLLLPVGDRALLKRPANDLVEAERVLDNPDYQRQAVAVRIASLQRTQREAMTRPNLSLNASLSSAECCVYGYSDVGNALTHAFTSQDSVQATVALLYQLPIGNRAAEAALNQAEHNLNQQAMALHQVELSTRESFETARGALASARERTKIAERTVKVAQEVYDSALAQQDAGLIAAYETLSRLSTLLSARTQLVQAQVDQRVAESTLLASVGALAEHYGDLTAQTGLDRDRLALLRESGALKHFGGPL